MPPGRAQTAWTWFLLAVWAGLMGFGAISICNPPWLEEFARLGKESEAISYKHYGDNAYRRGKLGLALAQYAKSLQIKPDEVSTRVSLGTTYLEFGRTEQGARLGYFEKGIECLQAALTENPSEWLCGVIHYNLGDAFERQKRPADALEQYRLAAARGMRPDQVYLRIGSLLLAAGRLEPALEAFERSLAAQMDPALAYRDMLSRTVDQYVDRPADLAAIAKLNDGLDDPETLARYDLTLIRQIQQTDREIAKTHNHIGYIRVRLDQFALAEPHFEKSLEIWPGNTDAQRNLEAVRRRLGK